MARGMLYRFSFSISSSESGPQFSVKHNGAIPLDSHGFDGHQGVRSLTTYHHRNTRSRCYGSSYIIPAGAREAYERDGYIILKLVRPRYDCNRSAGVRLCYTNGPLL